MTQSIAIPSASTSSGPKTLMLAAWHYPLKGLPGYPGREPTVWSVLPLPGDTNFDRFHQPCLFPLWQPHTVKVGTVDPYHLGTNLHVV